MTSMRSRSVSPDSQRMKERRWATVRLALGVTQMVGATVALVLLVQSGVSRASLTAVVLASSATALSVMLFGRDKPRGFRD